MSTLMMSERYDEDLLTFKLPLVYNRYSRRVDNIYTSARSISEVTDRVLEHDERAWLEVYNPCNLLACVDNLPDRLYRLMAVAFCRLTWTRLDTVHRRLVQVAEIVAEGEYPYEFVEPLLENHRQSVMRRDRRVLGAFSVAYNIGNTPSPVPSPISSDDYYISREPISGGVSSFERDMAKEDMKLWRRMYCERAAWSACLYNPKYAASQTLRHVMATGISKKLASMAINVLNRGDGTPYDNGVTDKLCHVIRDTLGNPYRMYPPVKPDLLLWHGGAIPQMAQHIYDNRDFQVMPILADMLEEADAEPVFVEHARHGGYHHRGCWLLDTLLNKRE